MSFRITCIGLCSVAFAQLWECSQKVKIDRAAMAEAAETRAVAPENEIPKVIGPVSAAL